LLSKPGFYEDLAARTRKLTAGLTAAAQKHGIAFCADSEGGMFGMYFSNTVPTTLAEVSASNIDMFKVFFHAMLDEGVYFSPSAYEAGFVSATHTDDVMMHKSPGRISLLPHGLDISEAQHLQLMQAFFKSQQHLTKTYRDFVQETLMRGLESLHGSA
jgi:hypothetical protein